MTVDRKALANAMGVVVLLFSSFTMGAGFIAAACAAGGLGAIVSGEVAIVAGAVSALTTMLVMPTIDDGPEKSPRRLFDADDLASCTHPLHARDVLQGVVSETPVVVCVRCGASQEASWVVNA